MVLNMLLLFSTFQEETNSAPPGNFEELKKSIEQYRELDKGNIYDKVCIGYTLIF